jgi:hypothetical protein
MTRRSRLEIRGSLFADGGTPGDSELAGWTAIDVLALSSERRVLYLRRERAIRMYLDGAPDVQIRANCGMGRGQAYRLLTFSARTASV